MIPSADTSDELPRCTVYRLRMAARAATRLYDEHLAPAGIGIAQYGLLRIVAEGGGASVTDLARRMGLDRTTLTRNLKPLMRAGYLGLTEGPDKRTRAIVITQQGRAVLAEARPLWKSAQAQLHKRLGADDHDALQHALGRAIVRMS